MGEENTFTGVGNVFYWCRKEDIGTENEQWHKANVDRLNIRAIKKSDFEPKQGKDDKPQGERKGFTNTFTFSLEPSEETKHNLIRFHRKIRKQQRGNRHYRRKLLKRIPKKELRRLIYVVRKFNIPSDII